MSDDSIKLKCFFWYSWYHIHTLTTERTSKDQTPSLLLTTNQTLHTQISSFPFIMTSSVGKYGGFAALATDPSIMTLRVGGSRTPARQRKTKTKKTKTKKHALPQVAPLPYNPDGCVGYVKPSKNQQNQDRQKLMLPDSASCNTHSSSKNDRWSSVGNGNTRKGSRNAIQSAVNTTQHPPLRLQGTTSSKPTGGYAALDGLPTEVVDEFPSIGLSDLKTRKPTWGAGSAWLKTTESKPLPNRPAPLTFISEYIPSSVDLHDDSPDYGPPDSPSSPISPMPYDFKGWAAEAAWIDGHEQRKQERMLDEDNQRTNMFHNNDEVDAVNAAYWTETLNYEQENDGNWYQGEDAEGTVEYV